MEYYFLVQSAANRSETFPDKTALSKANVKANWMGSTNGPMTKNEILPLSTEASSLWKFLVFLYQFWKRGVFFYLFVIPLKDNINAIKAFMKHKFENENSN